MYATYRYAAGSTAANFLSDVVAILTGETDVNNLSANCIKADSSILTTYDSAGWEMHDNASHTNGVMLRAINIDDQSYKYYGIQQNTLNAFSVRTAETWNPVTHTGTNQLGAYEITCNLTGGGYWYIYAHRGCIYILPYHNTAYQSTRGCFEVDNSRGLIPAGYPTWAITSNSTFAGVMYFPRRKNTTGTGDQTTTSASAAFYYSSLPIFRNSAEQTQGVLAPIWLGPGFIAGPIANRDIFAGSNLGAYLDTTVIDGVEYVQHDRNNFYFWVRKG